MDERKLSSATEDGIEIVSVLRGNPRVCEPLLVLLHGFSSGKDNATNRALLSELESCDLASLRFDFRGCYESAGEVGKSTISTGLLDLRAALSSAKLHQDQKFILVGSSYGAAVALAATDELKPKGIALRSPMVDIPAVQRERRGDVVMDEWRRQGFLREDKYDLSYCYVADAESYDLTTPAGELGRVPVVVVHGDRDEVVPYHYSQAFVMASPDTRRLVTIEGAGHHYDGDGHFEAMIGGLANGVREFLPE